MQAKAVYLTICLLFFSGIVQAKSEIPPVPTSSIYVQDYAGVLSAETKRQIQRAGQTLQEKTKAQIAVVLIKKLEGVTPEEYALGILRGWGVGDKERNNGVVLLVSVEDRQSRIEVGYGLEGALPDGKTGEIQDRYMIPYFQTGDYDAGVLNGYLALTQAALQEYGQNAAEVAPVAAAPEGGFLDTLLQYVAFAVIAVLVILDFMFFGGRFTMLVLSLLGRRGGGGGGFGGGSGGGGGSNRKW